MAINRRFVTVDPDTFELPDLIKQRFIQDVQEEVNLPVFAAEAAALAAENSRRNALESANVALEVKNAISGSVDEVAALAEDAENSRLGALNYRTAAQTAATNADTALTAASSAKTAAETARDASVSAKTASESARDSAASYAASINKGAPGGTAGLDSAGDVINSSGKKVITVEAANNSYGADSAPMKDAFAALQVHNPSALKAWNIALANRDNQRVTAYLEGDSFFESSATIGKRIPDLLQQRLGQQYPIIGGTPAFVTPEYIPPFYAINPTGSPDPTTITGAAGSSAGTNSPGLRIIQMTAAGTRRWTLPGSATSWRLYYTKTLVAGSFTVTVDGVLVQTVVNPVVNPPVDAFVVEGTFTGTGAHYVEVAWASGTVRVGGLEVFYGNENKGFHIIEAGHSGFTAGSFVETQRTSANSVQTSNADLFVLQLLTNDKATFTPAQYAANVATRLAHIRAVRTTPMSYLFVIPYQVDAGAVLAGYTVQDYRIAVRAMLAADPLTAWVDLQDFMPSTNSPEGLASGFYNADKIHPIAKGCARMVQVMMHALGVTS